MGGEGFVQRQTGLLHRGFVILKRAIPLHECDEIRVALSRQCNGWHSISGENRRKKISLNEKLIAKLQPKVAYILSSRFPSMKWELNTWVGIRSEPSGHEQHLHTDWTKSDWEQAMDPSPSSRTMRRKNRNGDHSIVPPASLIVALEDNTVLRVSPKSSIDYEAQKITLIQLKKGQICVFRANLVHGGARYEEVNIRIHAFLDPLSCVRSTNATHYAAQKVFPCSGCSKEFDKKAKLRGHERLCGNDDRAKENRNRKNEQNKQYRLRLKRMKPES